MSLTEGVLGIFSCFLLADAAGMFAGGISGCFWCFDSSLGGETRVCLLPVCLRRDLWTASMSVKCPSDFHGRITAHLQLRVVCPSAGTLKETSLEFDHEVNLHSAIDKRSLICVSCSVKPAIP